MTESRLASPRSVSIWLGVAAAIAVAGATLSACASTPTPGPATASISLSTQESARSAPQSTTPQSTTPQSTRASATASLSAGPLPTVVPTGPSPGSGVAVTLEGTVREGVEASCLVLEDDNGTVLANLLGDDAPDITAALTSGAKVEVTGSFVEGVMTTCQQGQPFQVTAVTAR